MTDLTDKDTPPLRVPEVEMAVARLNAELQRALGTGTEYCLVIAQDSPSLLNVQAMTNTTALRAHALLRAADGVGFDSLN